MPPPRITTAEHRTSRRHHPRRCLAWRKWGCYVTERAWGTVREDYSADGDAWDYLPHDLARSKAYRWGEDGIAGLCDRYQLLVFALGALERPRSDPQGAAVRPHARRRQPRRGRQGVLLLPRRHADARYMKLLYKYPQAEYPVQPADRREPPPRRRRARSSSCSTPASSTRTATSTSSSNTPRPDPEDICIRIEAFNRGPDAADCTSCRSSGSATPGRWGAAARPRAGDRAADRPATASVADRRRLATRAAAEPDVRVPARRRGISTRRRAASALFTDNETNAERVYGAARAVASPYVKDAFHRHIVNGEQRA